MSSKVIRAAVLAEGCHGFFRGLCCGTKCVAANQPTRRNAQSTPKDSAQPLEKTQLEQLSDTDFFSKMLGSPASQARGVIPKEKGKVQNNRGVGVAPPAPQHLQDNPSVANRATPEKKVGNLLKWLESSARYEEPEYLSHDQLNLGLEWQDNLPPLPKDNLPPLPKAPSTEQVHPHSRRAPQTTTSPPSAQRGSAQPASEDLAIQKLQQQAADLEAELSSILRELGGVNNGGNRDTFYSPKLDNPMTAHEAAGMLQSVLDSRFKMPEVCGHNMEEKLVAKLGELLKARSLLHRTGTHKQKIAAYEVEQREHKMHDNKRLIFELKQKAANRCNNEKQEMKRIHTTLKLKPAEIRKLTDTNIWETFMRALQ